MSIDQARMDFLALSLAQIADQQHKLSFEMATIRRMRRELEGSKTAVCRGPNGYPTYPQFPNPTRPAVAPFHRAFSVARNSGLALGYRR